jgi:hypothetical protein
MSTNQPQPLYLGAGRLTVFGVWKLTLLCKDSREVMTRSGTALLISSLGHVRVGVHADKQTNEYSKVWLSRYRICGFDCEACADRHSSMYPSLKGFALWALITSA